MKHGFGRSINNIHGNIAIPQVQYGTNCRNGCGIINEKQTFAFSAGRLCAIFVAIEAGDKNIKKLHLRTFNQLIFTCKTLIHSKSRPIFNSVVDFSPYLVSFSRYK